MRRFIAAFLVVICFLSIIGYAIILHELISRQGVAFYERLNDNREQLGASVTLKIPVSLPYAVPEFENYEFVNGDFSYDGTSYKMVRQKMYKDTLYIVCIKDDIATDLNGKLTDLAADLSDKSRDASKAVSLRNVLLPEFIVTSVAIVKGCEGWELKTSPSPAIDRYFPSVSFTLLQPPEPIG